MDAKSFWKLTQKLVSALRSNEAKTFTFDSVYDEHSTQQQVYEEIGFPIVESTVAGYNGTVFAYGQTGCGKTFTMLGENETPGLIPRAFTHVFSVVSDSEEDKIFLVRCSYFQIYKETIYDLLQNSGKLELREAKQGVFVKGLSMHTVKSEANIVRLMQAGTCLAWKLTHSAF